jgi:UDP-N-acetylmuramoyl-tripeptide--D-alanyl-D-alanine ligase
VQKRDIFSALQYNVTVLEIIKFIKQKTEKKSMRFDQHFVKGVLPDAEIPYASFPQDVSFSVDTRTLQPGNIFVAVSGAQVDGHNFIGQALAKNAGGLFIAVHKKELLATLDQRQLKNILVIIVPDTLHAFIKLASAWRDQFTYPVVGITGSVGKTSTKEILKNILRLNDIPFIASEGNQNTRIGVAINIFNMRANHKVAILELGISKRGEMAELAKIARPTTAIITGIGHAHMEGLGSLADIALEKRDIFKYFTEASIGIINGDQPLLANVGYNHPVVKFGCKTINQIQARKIQSSGGSISFILKIYREKYTISLQHVHEGAVMNSLAATAAAYLLNIPVAGIIKGIQQQLQVAGRFEEKTLARKKGKIIHDCYNANPESMKAALLAFQKIETTGQKIAVLGDMLELGVNSPFWHRQLGRFLRKVPSLKYLILVGDMVKWTYKTVPVTVSVDIVQSWQEAVAKLEEKLAGESVVLVKGSRGIALDNLVQKFT